MADNTSIEWTDASWTPVRARRVDADGTTKIGWHCEKVDAGCDNCYAGKFNQFRGTGLPFKPGHLEHTTRRGDRRGEVAIFLDEKMLTAPLRWKKPRRVFVCSMTDLFADFVTDEWLDQVFAVMALADWHTLQVLTKRPERARMYLQGDWPERVSVIIAQMCGDQIGASLAAQKRCHDAPLPNVWLGTSISDQASADLRIPQLLATPAAVRFVSAEPLLGPVDLHSAICRETGSDSDCPICMNGLGWLIAGGESGPGARPMHPDWARSLRDQCKAAGVAFFFKQWGEWGPGSVLMSTGEQVFRAFPNFQTWVNKASTWVAGGRCLDVLGRECQIGGDFMRARDEDAFPVTVIHRIGKSRAGRTLDGREWNEMPIPADLMVRQMPGVR